jgi:glycerophosphoryl diester phosphodiesterase
VRHLTVLCALVLVLVGPVWALPLIIAHRGASSRAPENTLPAFEQAIQAGTDWIELDVHLTKDDQIIVIHDETVDRTTNGHGRVADQTLEQLQALDAGSWFGSAFAHARLPTLDQVLSLAKGRVRVLIELKHVEHFGHSNEAGKAALLVRKCLECIAAHGMAKDVGFHTFYPNNLTALHRLSRGIPYAFLFDAKVPKHLASLFARIRGASGFNPSIKHVTRTLVNLVHLLRLQCSVYTVDTDAEYARAVALGVDGIITNKPHELRLFLAKSN